MKTIPKVLAIFIASVCALTGFIWWVSVIGSLSQPAPPWPELLSGLPANVVEAQAEFPKRVQAQFPVGSRASQLIEYLKKQGFRPDWASDVSVRRARFERGDWVCRNVFTIDWRSDQQGNLTDVVGVYLTPACL